MEPYQERVIEEKKELDQRATALSAFIGLNPAFERVDAEEQERMKEQCEIMWEYSEILGKRIAAFPSIDRSHEECCDCALLDVEPTQCKGHVAGPVSCKFFVKTN